MNSAAAVLVLACSDNRASSLDVMETSGVSSSMKDMLFETIGWEATDTEKEEDEIDEGEEDEEEEEEEEDADEGRDDAGEEEEEDDIGEEEEEEEEEDADEGRDDAGEEEEEEDERCPERDNDEDATTGEDVLGVTVPTNFLFMSLQFVPR